MILKASKQSVSELKRQYETEESGTSYERVRQYRIGFQRMNDLNF